MFWVWWGRLNVAVWNSLLEGFSVKFPDAAGEFFPGFFDAAGQFSPDLLGARNAIPVFFFYRGHLDSSGLYKSIETTKK